MSAATDKGLPTMLSESADETERYGIGFARGVLVALAMEVFVGGILWGLLTPATGGLVSIAGPALLVAGSGWVLLRIATVSGWIR